MNMSISKGAVQHLEQNVHFNNQTSDWIYSVPSEPDSTFRMADTQDATLEEFFSRPVRITSFSWTPGSAVNEYFDPWTSFFHNLRVVNRINNYMLLRCNLHVKFMINGNGFYYGRLIAGYIPRPNEIFGSPLPRSTVREDMIQLSQMPHVYLDPTTSQGGEFQLPFFCMDNGISIPEDGFAQMGAIQVFDLTTLAHANGGNEPVTVTVLAWASDVQLSIPCSTRNGAMAPQMGDEYAKGPISKPAATIARAAGALSKIPTIAPYAKATQLAATAIGDIASTFGYSRPTQEKPSETVKPEYVGVLANTNTFDNATKLTLDCKQEVTVDPRVTGLGSADELSILSISQRESYLTSFTWSGDNEADALLYAKYVTPMSFATYGSGLNQEFHLTPAAFAALPFSYWRGTIKFRFQFVASAFHKGRVKIVYDPYVLQSASLAEYNINYSHIADLGGERDFTLEFGWGQVMPWLPILPLDQLAVNAPSGSTSILTTAPNSIGANGLFSVVVVNELMAAAAGVPSIQVNVFVSTSDDFEVCVPSCEHIASLSWSPGIHTGGGPSTSDEPWTQPLQACYEAQAGDDTDPVDAAVESAPIMQSSDILAPHLNLRDHTLDVFFGDPVTSFRQCLKRYNFSRAWNMLSNEVTDGNIFVDRVFPDIPLYRGAVNDALDQALGSDALVHDWNFAKFTMLNYLLPAYAGRRGGIRWKYHMVGHQNLPGQMSVTLGRYGQGYSERDITVPDQSKPDYAQANNHAFFPHTWCATHTTDLLNNPVLEVELPYYNNRRFTLTRDTDVTGPGRTGTSFHNFKAFMRVGASTYPILLSYVSVAEDFNLFFFTGVPPLYVASIPPPYIPE